MMKGKLRYSESDPTFINSVSGWFISTENPSESYVVSKSSVDKIESGEHDLKSGDIVEYKLETYCYVKEANITSHSVVARLILNEEPITKVFLIDIDGTICEDIKNEDSHLYPTAKVYPESLKIINKWYEEGHVITFFTARESKDREVTELWLKENGFNYHGLVMDKPRIEGNQEYVWIDNRKVRAITYLGTWSELKEVDAKIQTFE
jgi:hypothetical protein